MSQEESKEYESPGGQMRILVAKNSSRSANSGSIANLKEREKFFNSVMDYKIKTSRSEINRFYGMK